MAEILVRPLTPQRLPDWLDFFDNDAFTDNPDWASCYCHFYLADHSAKDWETRSARENRAASCVLVQAGDLRGYLAFDGDRAVGWCHAAPRRLIRNLHDDPALATEDADRVGAIACFVVAPAYRRQGVARRLLEMAGEGFLSQGLSAAEAYPRKDADNDAANYHGPLSLYLESGFSVFKELDRVVVVRKSLSAG